MQRPLTVLAFVEAETVTGPVANLLQLDRSARSFAAAEGGPPITLVLALFVRGSRPLPPVLQAAARSVGLRMFPVHERCRFDPSVLLGMRRLAASIRPDVIQTHSIKSHWLTRFSGLTGEYPWIAFHHGYTCQDLKIRVYNAGDRVSLCRADRIVVPAHAFIPELVRKGVSPERIVVLHNAVDLSRCEWSQADRTDQRRRLGLAQECLVLLTIGRLSREKGHRDLLEAVAILSGARRLRHIRLVIVGDGPERERLRRQARAMGLDGVVMFLGHVDHAAALYPAADIAVLPSHSEGSPNALLEAAAYARPIIATAVGGVPEMLDDGDSGVLVPPGNPQCLADALQELLSDSRRATEMGQRARLAVATRHDPCARARHLIDLYRSVWKNRNSHSLGAPACAS